MTAALRALLLARDLGVEVPRWQRRFILSSMLTQGYARVWSRRARRYVMLPDGGS